MAGLTSSTIAGSYERLLILPAGGLNGTNLVAITDGDSDTASVLQIATTSALISGSGSKLLFSDNGGEYISGDGTNLTITSGADIILTVGATGSVYHTGDGGTSNTIYGKNAGDALASGGNYNVFLGEESGTGITVSDDNVAIGYNAFYRATTQADKNVAIGSNAMSGNFTTADVDSCVIIGYDAGSGTLTSGATGTVAIGHQAAKALTSGAANVAIGYQAATALTTGQENVVVGHQAMDAADGTEEGNTVLGHAAMGAMDEQGNAVNFNVAIGKSALLGGAASGDVLQNVAIGYNCMDATAANAQTGTVGIGASALTLLTSGAGNTAVGYETLAAVAGNSEHTAVGYQALKVCDGNNGNTALGYRAGYDLTSGDGNVLLGGDSGANIIGGSDNTIIGRGAGVTTTAGINMVLIGRSAAGGLLTSAATGTVAVGYQSLSSLTTGAHCIGIGYQAADALTVGDDNIGIGFGVMSALSTTDGTDRNIAIGTYAMDDVSSLAASDNIFIGFDAGGGSWTGTTSINNVAIGSYAMDGNLNDCDDNTAIGYQAFGSITTGKRNTGVGRSSGGALTLGDDNVFIGYGSGVDDLNVTTGDQNTIVGTKADASLADAQNQTVIGYNAAGQGNDMVVLGNADVERLYAAQDGGAVISAGGLGIGLGATAPSGYVFDVRGNQSGHPFHFFNDGNDANRYGIELTCGADDGSSATIYLRANDGDGSETGHLLSSSGTFSLADTSDIRLKENITDTSIDGLSSVNAMKVRDFQWKRSGQPVVAGFIANELKDAFSYAVDGESDAMEDIIDSNGSVTGQRIKPMTVSRDRLVPVLVKAIQELSAKVEALENA